MDRILSFVSVTRLRLITSRNQKLCKSSCKEIRHGVPQGSVFRPLLFLLYINDLPLNIQVAKLVLFADDIKILIVDKTIDPVQARLNWVKNSLKLGSQVTVLSLVLIEQR